MSRLKRYVLRLLNNGHRRDHFGWADLIDGGGCYCWEDE